jgi:hypothetical protein
MRSSRLALLTALALFAFAGNSLLCRLALRGGGIDAASFTAIRLASGALMLALLVVLPSRRRDAPASASASAAERRGDWPSAFALFAYAAAFSYAYLGLSAATIAQSRRSSGGLPRPAHHASATNIGSAMSMRYMMSVTASTP